MSIRSKLTARSEAPAAQETESEPESGLEPQLSAGGMLRAARLAQHRSLQEVARVLTMNVAGVEALERDQYHLLPNNVRVSHYLKSYAQLVRLPELEVVRAAEALLAEHSNRYRKQEGAVNGRGHLPFLRLLVLLMPVVALVLLVFWSHHHENQWHDDFLRGLDGTAERVPVGGAGERSETGEEAGEDGV